MTHDLLGIAKATSERFLLWRLYASLGRLYGTLEQRKAAKNALVAAKALIAKLATTIPNETLRERFQQSASRLS